MKGDFSRNTFKPDNHFSRVLMQQGRVQLDADRNEQTAILLHYLRALAADLIGPSGGPGDSFKIYPCVNIDKEIRDADGNLIDCAAADNTSYDNDFYIFKGHYYVNGIFCENERPIRYSYQTDYPLVQSLDSGSYLVYLDVWERHITHVETDEPIREVALGGPDTSSRAKVVWQVKTNLLDATTLQQLSEIGIGLKKDDEGGPITVPYNDAADLSCEEINGKWNDIIQIWWQPENRGVLQARAKITEEMNLEEPCTISPGSRYRRPENKQYRVVIHKGGGPGQATFKWSRENGSVIFPVTAIADKNVTLAHLGRDGRFTLKEGDWVEYVDDAIALHGQANPLYRVNEIDRIEMTVTLDKTLTVKDGWEDRHPILRRWDHQTTPKDSEENGLSVRSGWLKLEDGIQIQFSPAGDENEPTPEVKYRTGDYWLIPARVATGDVEWPWDTENNQPETLPPHGVQHHYAPLALIAVTGDGVTITDDCRHVFEPMAKPV